MSQIQKLYINETEAAHRYGFSKQWFQRARWKGNGPQFIKVEKGRVLYPLEETDKWFQSLGLKQSTSEYNTKSANDNETNFPDIKKL